MNIHQQAVLRKNREALCSGLSLDADLECSIIQYELFPKDKLEEIKSEKTNKRRIQKMLYVLERQNASTFNNFLTCIHKHYPWLSEELIKSYEEEAKVTSKSSTYKDMKCKIELFVHGYTQSKGISKEDEEELSNFLLSQLLEQTHLFSDDSLLETPEEFIVMTGFLMLTKMTKHDCTTKPSSKQFNLLHDMIASKISALYGQIRSLEQQKESCYETLNISDKTKLIHEILKIQAAQNESKQKESQAEIARLQQQLQQNALFIQELCNKIKEYEQHYFRRSKVETAVADAFTQATEHSLCG